LLHLKHISALPANFKAVWMRLARPTYAGHKKGIEITESLNKIESMALYPPTCLPTHA